MANDYDVLERKPTEIDLADVAKVSGGNWKRLLTYLGVPYDQTVTFLVSSSQNVHDACFEGLMYWRKGNAVVEGEQSPVTYSKLLQSMEDANMKSIAEEMRKKIVKRYKPVVNTLQPSSGGEPSSNVILDERSKKIKQVVQGYRNGDDISLPNDPELEGKYDSVMSELKVHLSAAKPKTLKRIHALFCNVYRRLQFGIKPVDMPHVPEKGPKLYKFLEDKFTPYELFLLRDAFKEMNNAKLRTKFTEYESVLSTQLMEKLTSCAARNVSLPKYDNHTHMAIAVSREQVLIALIIHLKEYFSAYLNLKEALFEGFQEGCTVFYFTITTTDAVLLAPRVLSHLAELKRRFSVTHIFVFGHFIADVDRGTIEPLAAHDRRQVVAVFEKVQQELISTKKKLDVVEEGFVEAEKMLRTSTVSWSEDKVDVDLDSNKVALVKAQSALEETKSALEGAEMKSEQLQHQLTASEMKLKLKEEELLEAKREIDRSRTSFVQLAKQKDELERPEETRKVWKEEDASSLHRAQDKLIPSFATLVNVFKHQVEVTTKSSNVADSIVVLCQATLARRRGHGRLPNLDKYYVSFGKNILDDTTIFDIEMIRIFANEINQPTLTEAIEKHEAVLKPLMEASIAELTERYIVEPVVQDTSKQAYKLVLKCPSDSLVGDLYTARYYLEKYLGIPEARLLTFPKRW